MKQLVFILFVSGVLAAGFVYYISNGKTVDQGRERLNGNKTITQRVDQYGREARGRLLPYFDKAGIPYPPDEIVLVGLKDEGKLEVWAGNDDGKLRHIRDYDILCKSGKAGPKLKEGDRQVPEGLYRIELLNPNSKYHLSLRVNYPNAFDRARGAEDGRDDLGGDIMIHGANVSIGCVPIGDEGVEDVFVMAAETGIENISVILSPVDLRKRELVELPDSLPEWTDELYEDIRKELAKLN